MIPNFRRVLNVVCFLLGNSPASEFYMPTFRNKPVLMYGAETWVLSKADELRLGVFERKKLRRIYGPICEGAIWRSIYNKELYRLYDETDLVTTVRITRLRRAGHIV